MEIRICQNRKELGKSAASHVGCKMREIIAQKDWVRIALSTGASQFDTLESLVEEKGIDWSKVEMFHLDEYVDLDETHPASFRKYLKERFVQKLPPLGGVHFVDGTKEGIQAITEEIRKAPIDIGLIGVGENAHIAFNDPPADFETEESYIIVNLNETCKKQQLGEGWFPTMDEVPKQAVSMTVHQIMQCSHIVSCVPYAVKANAVLAMLTEKETTNRIPATILREHPSMVLYLDQESASGVYKGIF